LSDPKNQKNIFVSFIIIFGKIKYFENHIPLHV